MDIPSTTDAEEMNESSWGASLLNPFAFKAKIPSDFPINTTMY